MRAQNLHFLILSLCGALGLVACTGDQGPPGEPGVDTLAATSDEPAGANCAFGGIKIEAGPDENGNGVLDPNEVANTTFVCNGEGTSALVRTSPEDAGDNCPFGGTRIETGLDANNNNVLDDDEVNADATSFVCNFAPNGAISPSTGVHLAYKSVSTDAAAPIVVRFTLKDDRGFPIDVNGAYSINTEIKPRFALAYYTRDGNGIVSPLHVLTKSVSHGNTAPSAFDPSRAGQGTMVENGLGAGDYSYTFPTEDTPGGAFAVAYDPAELDNDHVVWTQVGRQTDLVYQINANTFYAADEPFYFIPSGSGTPVPREIIAQDKCDNCHASFRAETTTSAAFHGGSRVAVGMCNVCHNPDRTSNPVANSNSFIHRIHNGEMVADDNLFHGIAATYPQDIRNCNTCHADSHDGQQALTNPTQNACKGCHDYVSFTDSLLPVCQIGSNLVRGSDGKPAACFHVAGNQPDSNCATCHGPTGGFPTEKYHRPVTPPDPNNAWLPTGTSNFTNASFVAAAGFVPTGADVITYDVKSVDTVTDTNVTPNVERPRITFKLLRNGTDVVFQTFDPTANPPVVEMIPDFVGSPSAYFAFSVPQDGIAAPEDFNASVSGYLKDIWDGSATGSKGGTLIGPDGNGYYELTLTGVQIPATAKHLTGGLGYTYALSSTPPLVQTNVPDYPFHDNGDGTSQGGLSIPAPNVWKVATGYSGRRTIVDNNKCNNCHSRLGVEPNFHAGHRNDGPTCSFCHDPNRTSSGWAVSSRYFIHAIHAGRKRVTPFTWHAEAPGEGFSDVEFPGQLNKCSTCHVDDAFDFTNSSNLDAVPGIELVTVAKGTYDGNPQTNPNGFFQISPYVTADNTTNYGSSFSYNAATNVTTEASGATLVISPIMAACVACHDAPPAIDHMKSSGGSFYEPRSSVLATGAPQEQCLLCHGPGRVAAIGLVHQR